MVRRGSSRGLGTLLLCFPLPPLLVVLRLALDTSRSFWLGYDSGGFAAAYFDSDPALTLTLAAADGGERWLDITEHAGVYYVLPYAMTTAYADANGEHYGTHPCAAFTITGDEFARLLAALEAT